MAWRGKDGATVLWRPCLVFLLVLWTRSTGIDGSGKCLVIVIVVVVYDETIIIVLAINSMVYFYLDCIYNVSIAFITRLNVLIFN